MGVLNYDLLWTLSDLGQAGVCFVDYFCFGGGAILWGGMILICVMVLFCRLCLVVKSLF